MSPEAPYARALIVRQWRPMVESIGSALEPQHPMNPCLLCLSRHSQPSQEHHGRVFLKNKTKPCPGHTLKQMTQNSWEWNPSTNILLKVSRWFLHDAVVEYSFPKHRANYINGNTSPKFWFLYIPLRLVKDDKCIYSEEESGLSILGNHDFDCHVLLCQNQLLWGLVLFTPYWRININLPQRWVVRND